MCEFMRQRDNIGVCVVCDGPKRMKLSHTPALAPDASLRSKLAGEHVYGVYLHCACWVHKFCRSHTHTPCSHLTTRATCATMIRLDPPRTRTWNLRPQRPTPYPLGQRAIDKLIGRTGEHIITATCMAHPYIVHECPSTSG